MLRGSADRSRRSRVLLVDAAWSASRNATLLRPRTRALREPSSCLSPPPAGTSSARPLPCCSQTAGREARVAPYALVGDGCLLPASRPRDEELSSSLWLIRRCNSPPTEWHHLDFTYADSVVWRRASSSRKLWGRSPSSPRGHRHGRTLAERAQGARES